ncbi:hypothetical protein KAT80_01630 [Candidatus Pacearchaeota archaeon]|nr:hypothetical protein [Candidatus Pacearchaeota archaeon]
MINKLTDLAIHAGVGIERHIQGISDKKDYESIEKLAKYLRDCVEQRNEYGHLQRDLDITSIMWEAFDRDRRYIEEVTLQTSFFYKKLEDIKQLRNQELTEIRNLCVKISREVMHRKQNYVYRLAA